MKDAGGVSLRMLFKKSRMKSINQESQPFPSRVFRRQIEIPSSTSHPHQRKDSFSLLETNGTLLDVQRKKARKLTSVQASSGSDRHSEDVPALQDKTFKILVCCPAILIFRGGFSLTFPSGYA